MTGSRIVRRAFIDIGCSRGQVVRFGEDQRGEIVEGGSNDLVELNVHALVRTCCRQPTVHAASFQTLQAYSLLRQIDSAVDMKRSYLEGQSAVAGYAVALGLLRPLRGGLQVDSCNPRRPDCAPTSLT
eukprot:6206209-Pleurochrysis_carterae.AAC.2